jgi:hypothetical protein
VISSRFENVYTLGSFLVCALTSTTKSNSRQTRPRNRRATASRGRRERRMAGGWRNRTPSIPHPDHSRANGARNCDHADHYSVSLRGRIGGWFGFGVVRDPPIVFPVSRSWRALRRIVSKTTMVSASQRSSFSMPWSRNTKPLSQLPCREFSQSAISALDMLSMRRWESNALQI